MENAMLRLTIDDTPVEVEKRTTVLHAARKLGIAIPTLCYLEGYLPSSSCMLCVVEDLESGKSLPACSSLALDGMRIRTRSPGLDRLRREALELLLSDHRGDCRAPCVRGCPAHLDIPEMLRRLARKDAAGAVEICLERIPLPATLGVVCPAPCEKVCRRAGHDGSLAIRRLKHFVGRVRLQQDGRAETDEAEAPRSGTPGFAGAMGQGAGWQGGAGQRRKGQHVMGQRGMGAPGKKRAAVVGAGPAGLSAAYYLTRRGFQCILYERDDAAGGGLLAAVEAARGAPARDALTSCEPAGEADPREILEAEIARIMDLGIELKTGFALGRELALERLARDFDAVVLATGSPDTEILDLLSSCGIRADEAGNPGRPLGRFPGGAPVFACGSLLKPSRMAVRAVAQGRAAANGAARCFGEGTRSSGGTSVTAYASASAGGDEGFDFPFGRLQPGDMEEFLRGVSQAPPAVSTLGTALLSPGEAEEEAARCLQCDCGAAQTCLLRKYAGEYGAAPRGYPRGEKREFRRILEHPDLVYEPGKCIQCGRCIWIAEAAGERLGLAFQKRGFDVRVGVPFEEALSEGLEKSARACAEVCPTGALIWKRRR